MICVVIKGPTFKEVHQQISKAIVYADLVELRLDHFDSLELSELKALRSDFSIPMIFTLRSQLYGGNYKESEERRLIDISQLAKLKPEYLDLESQVPSQFIEEICFQYSEIKLILSHHDFRKTPEDLDALYREMKKIPAFFYKIAVTANNCLDTLRFLCWAKKTNPQLIAISMGMHGQISRILSPILQCPIVYTALEKALKLAPGQFSGKTLIEQYHHHSLHPRTKIYGLIGDPVEQSISDNTHNHLMEVHGLDSVYVKIQVNPKELPEFLQLAKRLPFHGLSVTMPLKEHILPFLDKIDPLSLEIGAVNTLVVEKGKLLGFNTDGIGALNAIERKYPVKGKQVVIIGAGGASKAIAYETCRRGGNVTIINRDSEKARQVAQRLNCTGKGLDHMTSCAETGYDILINCTSSPMPIDPNYILPEALVMDVMTAPKETAFLKHAIEKKCKIIYGYQMFIEQALGQFHLWFNDRCDIQASRKILEKRAVDCIQEKN